MVGSTFVLNTHPVTIVGVTPPTFYGDRMSDSPPDFFIPMVMEPLLDTGAFLHRPNLNWVYLLGRVKPGTALAPLREKMNASLRQWLTSLADYQTEDGKKALARTHLALTPGGIGIAQLQEQYGNGLNLLMGISALVLLIAVREHCQPDAGAWDGASRGDVVADGAGGAAEADYSPDAD